MSRGRYTTGAAILILLLAIVLFASSWSARAEGLLPTPGNTDEATVFLFRGLVSILLGIIAWFVKKVDKRQDDIEAVVAPFKNLETRLHGLDGENKQQQQQINLLRDKINTEHPTKSETAEHRKIMEDGIREIKQELREGMRNIHHRIDTQSIYHGHRRDSDERG
jgi:hypothetical protein